MKRKYSWDGERGVVDSRGIQAVQLITTGAESFRERAGRLLVKALNGKRAKGGGK